MLNLSRSNSELCNCCPKLTELEKRRNRQRFKARETAKSSKILKTENSKEKETRFLELVDLSLDVRPPPLLWRDQKYLPKNARRTKHNLPVEKRWLVIFPKDSEERAVLNRKKPSKPSCLSSTRKDEGLKVCLADRNE